jgi:hypothetical protein
MALSFGVHGELNALVDTVQVVQEILQLIRSLWPDDECVVHVAKPAEGLAGEPSQAPSPASPPYRVGNGRRQWRSHGHAINLFVELAIEP